MVSLPDLDYKDSCLPTPNELAWSLDQFEGLVHTPAILNIVQQRSLSKVALISKCWFNFGNRHGWGEYFDAKSQRMYRGGWVNGFRHGHGWERAVLNMVSPSRSARERKSACALLGRCTATVWPMLDGLCSGLMV